MGWMKQNAHWLISGFLATLISAFGWGATVSASETKQAHIEARVNKHAESIQELQRSVTQLQERRSADAEILKATQESVSRLVETTAQLQGIVRSMENKR